MNRESDSHDVLKIPETTTRQSRLQEIDENFQELTHVEKNFIDCLKDSKIPKPTIGLQPTPVYEYENCFEKNVRDSKMPEPTIGLQKNDQELKPLEKIIETSTLSSSENTKNTRPDSADVEYAQFVKSRIEMNSTRSSSVISNTEISQNDKSSQNFSNSPIQKFSETQSSETQSSETSLTTYICCLKWLLYIFINMIIPIFVGIISICGFVFSIIYIHPVTLTIAFLLALIDIILLVFAFILTLISFIFLRYCKKQKKPKKLEKARKYFTQCCMVGLILYGTLMISVGFVIFVTIILFVVGNIIVIVICFLIMIFLFGY